MSVISVWITLIAAILGIVGYVTRGSSLLLCFGLENCVDFISSMVVLWRFYCPGGMEPDAEYITKLERREKKASVAISFVLFFLGIGILAAAFEQFEMGSKNKEPTGLLLGISFCSILIFGTFTVIKLQYATCLQSPALHKDGFCSFIGTSLSFSLFMDTLLAMWDPSTWWLEPMISSIVGVLAMGVGLRSILRSIFINKIPIYSPSWWMSTGEQSEAVHELGQTEMAAVQNGQDEIRRKTEGQEII